MTCLIYTISKFSSIVGTNLKENLSLYKIIVGIKIFVNHSIILYSVNTIKFGWHPFLSVVINIETFLSKKFNDVIRFDCVFVSNFMGMEDDLVEKVLSILIFFGIIAILCASLIYLQIRSEKRDNRPDPTEEQVKVSDEEI